MRREKKKGMVETYEGEVSKLENSLNLLKVHSFGSGQSHDLINALGMYRLVYRVLLMMMMMYLLTDDLLVEQSTAQGNTFATR